MKHATVPCSIFLCLLAPFGQAQTIACNVAPLPADIPHCSLTVLNDSCRIEIDRRNPVVPSNLYLRRNATLAVRILAPSALEALTLDKASGALTPQPDVFSNGFASLTAGVGSIAFTFQRASAGFAASAAPGSKKKDEKVPLFEAFLDRQNDLDKSLQNAATSMSAETLEAELGPALVSIKGALIDPLSIVDVEAWKATFDRSLASAIAKIPPDVDISAIKEAVKKLDEELALAYPATTDLSPAQVRILETNETQLDDALSKVSTAATDLKSRLTRIRDAVDGVRAPLTEVECVITAPHPVGKEIDTDSWTLDASLPLKTQLSPLIGDKLPDLFSTSLSGLTDVPAKTKILSIQVTYQDVPWVEISGGVLFPVLPYHSYQAVTSAVGVSTVQKTRTFAVIPDASFNFRFIPEYALGHIRFTAMVTMAAGYSSSSSSAAFGTGVSFAFGSLVFSPLVVATQDNRLTGGFAANGPLGTAATPATHSVWSAKPSIGISLRLPLSGSTN